ncbi:unnamed protein product [Gongylonema pulchrum]|uniref:CCDC66 domain-containing protein n=1 Tax=Gongylonema pulchrum TaxID=637853 RepID=A0A183EZC8_9BILA|nr:unnamed protein product [Gongylonema pulchrum]VDN45384.1 unnamed protein product [Gongylonema pulchrum]
MGPLRVKEKQWISNFGRLRYCSAFGACLVLDNQNDCNLRLEEERRLKELREQERRNAEQRERERQEALEREAHRQREDRRSRDKLDQIAREIEEKEKMEAEKQRLLAQITSHEQHKDLLTSRETLEKLTKPPYYSRENLATIPYGSKENLSIGGGSEVTTKVERQVIERVDRTVWSSDPRYSL